jgi:hypothetical protein
MNRLVIIVLASFAVSLIGCDLGKPQNKGKSGGDIAESPASSEGGNTVRDAVRDADGSRLSELDATYISKKHGFSFKYSSDWRIDETNNEWLHVLLPDENGKNVGCVVIHVATYNNPKLMKTTRKDIEEAQKGTVSEIEKIKFDGDDCLYYTVLTLTDRGSQKTDMVYEFNNKKRFVSLSFAVWNGYDDKFAPYFDAILKSFKM